MEARAIAAPRPRSRRAWLKPGVFAGALVAPRGAPSRSGPPGARRRSRRRGAEPPRSDRPRLPDRLARMHAPARDRGLDVADRPPADARPLRVFLRVAPLRDLRGDRPGAPAPRDLRRRHEAPFIIVGFSAFLLLVPLAATSTAASVRRLGFVRWKRLHRLVYAAAVLGRGALLAARQDRPPRAGGLRRGALRPPACPRRALDAGSGEETLAEVA